MILKVYSIILILTLNTYTWLLYVYSNEKKFKSLIKKLKSIKMATTR